MPGQPLFHRCSGPQKDPAQFSNPCLVALPPPCSPTDGEDGERAPRPAGEVQPRPGWRSGRTVGWAEPEVGTHPGRPDSPRAPSARLPRCRSSGSSAARAPAMLARPALPLCTSVLGGCCGRRGAETQAAAHPVFVQGGLGSSPPLCACSPTPPWASHPWFP